MHDLTEGREALARRGPDDLRGEFADDDGLDLAPEEARELAGLIVFGMNVADDDMAFGSILWDAVAAMIVYVEGQPCSCPTSESYPPCERCRVLGQRDRERIER